jgi:demethylmenaquinone methyltransferase/2-methoxy-6-polyprenyl-1,4-benzoquinol methylase
MFARISRHYDLLNRVMTFGQDGQWRRETVRIAVGEHARWILDLGAGTGDLALEARRQCPRSNVVAVDFTSEMLILGREKGGGDQIMWIVADGQNLPFKNDVFDSSVSAFLVRNLHLVEPVLIEQHRVLAPEGTAVSLDTTPPTRSIFQPIVNLYLNYVVPLLGRLLARDQAAYQYLRDTTKHFLTSKELEQKMIEAGYIEVESQKKMFGIIAIHSGRKPDD